MSNEWDGKVVMSTPGGPIVEMSLGDLLERKDAEIERLREEAAQQLDGYRELAARVNELTLQRDAAVTLLAEWCHAVDVGGAGWDYWDNQYKEARWGKGILRSLIDAEIAKLEPLEGKP